MKNTMLQDTKQYAVLVDYYKNAKKLGLTDKEVIERAANDYCLAIDNYDSIKKTLDSVDANEISVEDYEDLQHKLAAEDRNKSNYLAVLMMKFWYAQAKMQKQCKSVTLYEYGDYFSQLAYCINTAMQYRAWQNSEKKTNAQACINAAIASRGAAEILYQSNLAKNKVNINCASLDQTINSDSDDKEKALGDLIAAEDSGPDAAGSEAMSIVQGYIDAGKVVDAIIIDNIAFGDATKVSKETVVGVDEKGEEYKYTVTSRAFWPFKLVKMLNATDESYIEAFVKRYRASSAEMKAALDYITKASNPKLYKQVDACLDDLRRVMLG